MGDNRELHQYAKLGELLSSNTDILVTVLPFLDVVNLVRSKRVCSLWKECCSMALSAKLQLDRRPIANKKELICRVNQYVCRDPDDLEDIARECGVPIGTWDVSKVTDFSRVFYEQRTFNEDISGWDVSNARTMEGMFCRALSFNQNLNDWNVSSVVDMRYMFQGAVAFNGLVSKWVTASVWSMESMFEGARSFNQDISKWDVSNVTAMEFMFLDASSFNQNLNDWNASSLEDVDWTFCGAGAFDARVNWPQSHNESDRESI